MTDALAKLPARLRVLGVYWALNAVLLVALLAFALR